MTCNAHFRGRGLGVPLPASSRLPALLLALFCLSVGLGALGGLGLLHLARLLALLWSGLLLVCSLISRGARAERPVEPRTEEIFFKNLLCNSVD